MGLNDSNGLYQADPVPISADVRLNFTVFVEVDESTSAEELIKKLQISFGDAFADKLMISDDRISDVSVVYAGNRTFTTKVCMYF